MRNPFRISFFHPKFCINRLVGADHHKPKLRISTNLRSWTKFASSEHANENCTKIAQILRHMDESCTQIARIASDEKCAEIARKIARKIQSGQRAPECAPTAAPHTAGLGADGSGGEEILIPGQRLSAELWTSRVCGHLWKVCAPHPPRPFSTGALQPPLCHTTSRKVGQRRVCEPPQRHDGQ